jgi:hypothetical protein
LGGFKEKRTAKTPRTPRKEKRERKEPERIVLRIYAIF